VRTETVHEARCLSPKAAARVPLAAYGRGMRSVRLPRFSFLKRVERAVIVALSALVKRRPTVVT
jgi:hypothetical protein